MDISIKWPFKWTIVGSSGSGKTHFSLQIIKNSQKIFDNPPTKLIILYEEYQPIYDDFKKYIPTEIFQEKEFDLEKISLKQETDDRLLILFDDLYFSNNLDYISQFFLVKGRHRNISLIFLTQSIYNKSSLKNISRNSDHITLFKSIRLTEPHTFFSQLRPGSSKVLKDIYEKATEKPHSYIDIDLSQTCPDKLRYKSDIFDKFIKIYEMNGNSFKTMYVISKTDKEALEKNNSFKLNVENDSICKDGLNISVKPVKPRGKKVQFDTSKGDNGNEDDNNDDEDRKNTEIVENHDKNGERYSEISDLDTDYDEAQMLERLNKLRHDYDYPQQTGLQPVASAIPFQNIVSQQESSLPSINYASFEDNETVKTRPKSKIKQSSLSQHRFSPYPRRQPSVNKKISQQRKVIDDEINRLSHIRQQSHEVYPETLPLPANNVEEDLDETENNVHTAPKKINQTNVKQNKTPSPSLLHYGQLSRLSPYSIRPPTLNEKISQQRKIIADEINRLSHIRQQVHDLNPETISLPELEWDKSRYNDHATPIQTSKQVYFKQKKSPYSTSRPSPYKKKSQERKNHDDEISRLSNIRQQVYEVPPEATPLPEDNDLDWDVTPIQTSNNDLKTLLNSNRVQFKRKKNNTLNYRIVPEDQQKSLIKSTDFKTLPSSVASSIWISTPRKNQYAFKKFKKYTKTKKHLLDGSFKDT
jgi:hypothetical protein